jgi:hypothetical protein
MIDLSATKTILEESLCDLLYYYRAVKDQPPAFKEPTDGLEGDSLTQAWTKADIGYFETSFRESKLLTSREQQAQLRLPPDLIVRANDEKNGNPLLVHIERETKKLEWNHVFGALTKLLIINDNPAPYAVLILGGIRDGNSEHEELLLSTAKKLFTVATKVEALYIAHWRGYEWKDSTVTVFEKKNGQISQRCL